MPPSNSETNGSKAVALCSWIDGVKTIAVGTHFHFLGRGGLTGMERSDWVMTPWRKSCRPCLMIQPLLTPLVGGLQLPGCLPPSESSPPPTTENWLDAIGAAPEKNQERSGSPECDPGPGHRNRVQNRIREKGLWKKN